MQKSGRKIALGVSMGLVVGVGASFAQAQQPKPGEAAAAPQPGAPVDPKALEFFESKIRPVLSQQCFACHNDKNTKGGLKMHTPEGFFKGGDSGPLVVPGHPEKSLLIDVVSYNKDLKMPPQGKLKPQQLADLTAWVKMGAPWPNAKLPASTGGPGGPLFNAEQKAFWAFQPMKDPALPAVKNKAWIQSPIDNFILAKLEAKGLKPAPKADKRTLIRRVTFDLTGLPPTPAEVEAFLKDTGPDAWTRVVDRLLASPAYGERWGRHWLDVARYADSNGLDENTAFGNAWRYRDYVIRAFNQDKPYNEFVREQIAGDLLPASQDDATNADRLTATGFLVLGPKVLAEPDKGKMMMDIVDEQIDTTGKAFMGMTLGCARCHDHKFDPLPTKDYYSLAGIFKSTRTMKSLNTVAQAFERPIADPNAAKEAALHASRLSAKQDELRKVEGVLTAAASKAVVGDLHRYLLTGLTADVTPLRNAGGAPDTSRPGSVIVEAEKFKKGDVTVSGQYIESAGRSNAFTEYEIELPKAGEYDLAIRYASGEQRPVRILLGGKVVKDRAASRPTGGFGLDKQAWETQASFIAEAGKQTLRLEQMAGSLPHVDKLALIPAPVAPPTVPGARPRTGNPVELAKAQSLDAETLRRSASYLLTSDASHSVWGPWVALSALPEAQFAEGAKRLAAEWQASGQSKKWLAPVAAAFAEAPKTLAEAAERYQGLFQRVNEAWAQQLAGDAKPSRLADNNMEALRLALYGADSAFGLDKPERLYPAADLANVTRLKAQVAAIQKEAPEPNGLVLAVEDAKAIENVKVHIRGNHLTLGDETPRQFLQIVAGEKQKPIGMDRSGRLELADWMTRADHPLTSRVMVNRMWQHHFGEGLVRTPDNFGKLGDRPSHPELLDWLAKRFIEKGWSMKAMHRMMLHSSAYQMSSAHDAKAALADPENRLLWHFNRRRLEVEAIRDSMLAVSGKLDPTMGGSLLRTKNFDYVTNDQSGNGAQYDAPRRSIYLPVIRNAVFDVFQVFDFVEPSFTNGKRVATTVAPQALFLMNGDFVMAQAKAFSQSLAKDSADDAARVRSSYMRAFGREATPAEVSGAQDYLKLYANALTAKEPDAAKRHEAAWASYCQILFASNEFVFVN